MAGRAGDPGEKLVRVLAVLDRLTLTRHGISSLDLAAELEINVRSVQRYIQVLRDRAGIDVIEEAGRYKLSDDSKLPPLQLDRSQAAAVLIAIRLLQQSSPYHDPALTGAVAKLAMAIKTPAVTAFFEHVIESVEERPKSSPRIQIRRTVLEAFAEQMKLEIKYKDFSNNESKRVIHS